MQAKVGKKKFVCKVTVKKAGTNQNADKNNGKKTAKPTVKPTEKPVLPSTPTPKPTEKPSLPSTPTPKPDNKPDPTPIETMMPPDETPAPTVKPESNYQGLYAEKEPLCTDPQMLDQKSNDWRSIFLWLNIVLNLKRK